MLCCLGTMLSDLAWWVKDPGQWALAWGPIVAWRTRPQSCCSCLVTGIRVDWPVVEVMGEAWLSDTCHTEFTLFYFEVKKIHLFNFGCHLCNLHATSYSQLQSSVLFSGQGSSHWISFLQNPPLTGGQAKGGHLAPTVGRHVLDPGTQLWRSGMIYPS